MYQTVSFPLCGSSFFEYRDWSELRGEIHALGCDGLEGIWSGEEFPADMPKDLIIGYHILFYPDWLDFYWENRTALLRKFGSLEAARSFYGGPGPEVLLDQYRADLNRAEDLGARYVVFHVSDVSIEEGYTYQWLHTDEEVIDASVEVINTLLGERVYSFDFLVENQWWPGFTFTEPDKTARLLGGIRYPRKGIMLDTGHLMNANTSLRTQAQGAAFIRDMLDRHGSLAGMIRGVHLHQSLSGAYVERNRGAVPSGLPNDYGERFRVSYSHILRVDRHLPWSDPAILPVLERIAPEYITHELYAENRAHRTRAVRQQRDLMERGGKSHV
ncbi:MAG: sugar phosphate isomerase/epimerase family protein [Faecousia sp.]